MMNVQKDLKRSMRAFFTEDIINSTVEAITKHPRESIRLLSQYMAVEKKSVREVRHEDLSLYESQRQSSRPLSDGGSAPCGVLST